MQQSLSRRNTMAVSNPRFWLRKQFKMHGHLVTRSSRHTVNSSQRRYTRRSTRHTILGDFRMWRVDRVTSWLAPPIGRLIVTDHLNFIWPRPFQGWFAICELALAMTNLCTKFEDLLYLHPLLRYKRRYKMWKIWKMGWVGIVRSLKVTGNSAIRYSTYEFLILLVFHSNYVPILHHFCDIARFWSKMANLNLLHLCLAPLLGVTPLEFRGDVTKTHVTSQCMQLTVCIQFKLINCKKIAPRMLQYSPFWA